MTARRRTIKRKSMRGIAQSVNKKSLRWAGANILKFKGTFDLECEGIKIILTTDKNGQLCDIQPRLGSVHTNYQGQPVSLISPYKFAEEIKAEIAKLSEEKLKMLKYNTLNV